MDDMKFLFFIVPGTFALIGFIFSLIFGPKIMRWCAKQKADWQNGAPRAIEAEEQVESAYVDRPSRVREKELLTR